ncbi:MAG: hypothetical protein EOP49_39885, partial [Sphingobacteriales bacterium]
MLVGVWACEYWEDLQRKKMTNPGENFGLFRQNYALAVEARQPIAIGDTLHYKMTNLAAQTYTVSIQVQYLAGVNVLAEFVDRFTNTRRMVSLSTTTTFPVTITSDPASKAWNRFYLVFSDIAIAGGPLPVKFTSVSAQRQADKGVAVNWKVAEMDVKDYTVEKSTDGSSFNAIGHLLSKSDGTNSYSFTESRPLEGNGYYRIKQTDKNGRIGNFLQ